jgi:hypothetical protein
MILALVDELDVFVEGESGSASVSAPIMGLETADRKKYE